VSIGFLVPDWAALVATASDGTTTGSDSRVISSQATDVRLVLNDVVGPWVGLSTFASSPIAGTDVFKKYSSTFKLPARAYASIGVELGWGDGTGMNVQSRVGVCTATLDSNNNPIVVVPNSTIQVEGTVLPKGFWGISVGQNSGSSSLPAKGMRFFKFSAARGASYTADLFGILDGGLFAVDNTGKLLLDSDGTVSAPISGSGSPALSFTIPSSAPASSNWYLALYAPTGGSPSVTLSLASVASTAAATTPVINEIWTGNGGAFEIANFSSTPVDFAGWSLTMKYKNGTYDMVQSYAYLISPKDASAAPMSCSIPSGGYLAVRLFNWRYGFKNENCLESADSHWDSASSSYVPNQPQAYKGPELNATDGTTTYYQNLVYARDVNGSLNVNSLQTWGYSWSVELRDNNGTLVDYARFGNSNSPVPLPTEAVSTWPAGATVNIFGGGGSYARAVTTNGGPSVDSGGPSEWFMGTGTLGAPNDAKGLSDLQLYAY
jgi:hypothetical protein